MRNLITDVEGVSVGHADDARLASGVTAILFAEPAVASIDVRGGGPGTRETDLLEPSQTVERIDAIALSGGSALGLEAAAGVQAWLRERGRGFPVRSVRVPLVPGAILFDLLNGGDKNWGRFAPYRDLGYRASDHAGRSFLLGSAGAGLGATTADLKGGLGSASMVTPSGHTIGALAAVNAAGSAVIGGGPHFWAAPFETGAEFGGLGSPARIPSTSLIPRTKASQRESTTLAVVVTDAILTKPQAKRLAVMAQTGVARAIYPVHTPLDGDVCFATATGQRPLADPFVALMELGSYAAQVVARAIARGIYEASALDIPGVQPSWRDKFAK